MLAPATRPLHDPREALTPWAAPALAALCALCVVLFGWHGADLPAQAYRVALFRRYGFLTFDTFWYGGHYLITYSFLAPAMAATLGLRLVGWLGAVVAAAGFSRLTRDHAGSGAMPSALLFAAGTAVPLLVGEITFLTGFAIGLWALICIRTRHRHLGAVLSLACTLASPLAGLFLLLSLLAWVLADRSRPVDRLVAAGAAALPLAVSALVFPEVGSYGFAWGQLLPVLACGAIGAFLVPARLRPVRIGLMLYAAAGVVLFLFANPVGGNLVRLGAYVTPALATSVFWPERKRLLALILLPALVWQWSSGVTDMTSAKGDPTRSASYFQPLVDRLDALPAPTRLEIPFTSQHWEADYVAPHMALARGWERQLDLALNPLFYRKIPPSAADYRQWLYANGVSWVALPDATPDPAGLAEANLIRSGLPYLEPLWHDRHWRLWKVLGSPGLVDGPARLTVNSPSQFSLAVSRPSVIVVRFRYTRTWMVTSGRACTETTRDGWTRVKVWAPGEVQVTSRLLARHVECPDP